MISSYSTPHQLKIQMTLNLELELELEPSTGYRPSLYTFIQSSSFYEAVNQSLYLTCQVPSHPLNHYPH